MERRLRLLRIAFCFFWNLTLLCKHLESLFHLACTSFEAGVGKGPHCAVGIRGPDPDSKQGQAAKRPVQRSGNGLEVSYWSRCGWHRGQGGGSMYCMKCPQ